MFNINNEDYIADDYNNPDNYEPGFIDIDSIVPLDSIDSNDADEIASENEHRKLHYGGRSEFRDH